MSDTGRFERTLVSARHRGGQLTDAHDRGSARFGHRVAEVARRLRLQQDGLHGWQDRQGQRPANLVTRSTDVAASPIAHTLATFVRLYSSTTIAPFSTSIPASSQMWVRGRTPAERTIRSLQPAFRL